MSKKRLEERVFSWLYKLCGSSALICLYFLLSTLVPPTRDAELALKIELAWKILITSAATGSTIAIFRLP